MCCVWRKDIGSSPNLCPALSFRITAFEGKVSTSPLPVDVDQRTTEKEGQVPQ